MTSERLIADRLRDLKGDYRLAICLEAADEIERLRAALQKIVTHGDSFAADPSLWPRFIAQEALEPPADA